MARQLPALVDQVSAMPVFCLGQGQATVQVIPTEACATMLYQARLQ